jgi:hypothetical protein
MPGMTKWPLFARRGRRPAFLVAILALALTVPLAGCGLRRDRGDAGADRTGSTSQPMPETADPAAAQDDLDDLDSLLGDADDALNEADATPADAD